MASAIGNDVKIGNLDMKIYDIHVRWDQCLKLSQKSCRKVVGPHAMDLKSYT